VRVGMAYGPVLPLMGDVFGTTVNLASRLTAMARPGTALVDAGLATELRDDGAYELARIARRRVRGLGVVQPYVLRRSGRSH
jgi:adenylate cyclase